MTRRSVSLACAIDLSERLALRPELGEPLLQRLDPLRKSLLRQPARLEGGVVSLDAGLSLDDRGVDHLDLGTSPRPCRRVCLPDLCSKAIDQIDVSVRLEEARHDRLIQ